MQISIGNLHCFLVLFPLASYYVNDLGISTTKQDPSFSLLSTDICPPCSFTIVEAIDNPRPVPSTVLYALDRLDKIDQIFAPFLHLSFQIHLKLKGKNKTRTTIDLAIIVRVSF